MAKYSLLYGKFSFFVSTRSIIIIIIGSSISIIVIYSFRVFHISTSWWFFTGVWVTASLLKSPGLFSVFWPFSAVILIVSTYVSTSKSFNNPLLIVPKALITIGTFVTFMFHSFFNSRERSRYLSFFSHSFSFIL